MIVTPVYNDVEACRRLFLELAKELGAAAFVVAVDDGSVLKPLDPSVLEEAGLPGVVIRLKRNVGHQRALAIGINYVAEHMPDAVCVLMDSDGEDVPAAISALIEPLASPDVDVVVAKRGSRFETIKFKAFYVLYKTSVLPPERTAHQLRQFHGAQARFGAAARRHARALDSRRRHGARVETSARLPSDRPRAPLCRTEQHEFRRIGSARVPRFDGGRRRCSDQGRDRLHDTSRCGILCDHTFHCA